MGALPLIKALVSGKIDLSLNAQAFFDPVFKCCLSDLKINLSDKSYSKDNRLNRLFKLTLSECSHLDVGLCATKICSRFIGASAHRIRTYVSWVQNDVNQFGLYL